MNRLQLYENVLTPAVRQALVWGGGGYLAHKASQMADNHHTKELEKRKLLSKEELEKRKEREALSKKTNIKKAIGTTLASAAAGALGIVI